MKERFAIAAAQAAPAFLDLEASLAIAEKWIADAGKQGIRLLVFPETWLPGYPIWIDTAPEAALWDSREAKAAFRRLYENSPAIRSDAVERLCVAARKARIVVVMGLNEKQGRSLYNSILYISDRGELLGVHRKLIPTYTERMIWGRGDGSTLTVVDTSLGRVGGLVCWEHWMPLARQAIHEKEELVHAAVWPTVHELHQVASRSYAFEGRVFVVAAGSVLRREHLPTDLPLMDKMPGDAWMFGGSAVIGPDGTYLAGPADDTEQFVAAEIDPGRVTEELMTLDVCGHYSRPDVFDFSVRKGKTDSLLD
jgi:predicted amidohydrolase